ncbi:hypothetical protein GCM10009668_11820 [Nocardioides dubius]|uniref:Ig-like domain-containing protein n=1 Tax=Nocardioides dubius TaxID=317019 RepID=A0ABN1TPE7_9ACTN
MLRLRLPRALLSLGLVASGLTVLAAVSGPLAPAIAAPAFTVDGDSVAFVHGVTGSPGSNNPRVVAGNGTISTLTLSNGGWLPRGGALAPDGTLYLQDASVVPTRVVKIAPDGAESLVATLDFPAAGQVAPTSGDITILPDGDLVVSAYRSPNTRFTRVDPSTGAATTLFTLTGGEAAARTSADAAGNLYYLTTLTSPKQVWRVSPTVGSSATVVGGTGTHGYDLAVDATGNAYVAGGVGAGSSAYGAIDKLALQPNGSYTHTAGWATTPTVAQNGLTVDGGVTVTPNGQVVMARASSGGDATLFRYSMAGGTAVTTQPVTGVSAASLTALPGGNPFDDPVDASYSGTRQVGETLTASAGTYAPVDATISYVWRVGSNAVATTPTYVPRLADGGKNVSVVVTGRRAGFTDSVSTSAGQTIASVRGFSGTLRAGETLTADDAEGTQTWRLSAVSSCASPTSATGATYTLPLDSAGKFLSLSQTLDGRTGGGLCVGPILSAGSPATITGPSTATGVKGQAFTYTPSVAGQPAPTITLSGSLPGGITLNSATGTLAGEPTEAGSFPVVLRADNGVSPAATHDLTITIADVVTGLVPTISGTPKVGVPLTASPGAGLVPSAGATLTYQWQYQSAPGQWADLPSGASATYTPDAADLGRVLRVRVTVAKSGFQTRTEASPPTAAVAHGTFTIDEPSITGTARVGETLTCVAAPGTPGSLTYAWTWGQEALIGTSAAHVVSYADLGRVLTCTVVAQRPGYVFVERSVDTATVAEGTFSIAAPSITGTAEVGRTLSCAAAPGTPGALSYAWSRGATPLGTGAQHLLTAADRTHEVTCTVTAARPGYTDATNSADSEPVGYGTFAIGAPTISGTAAVGETISCAAAAGTPGTVSYAWSRGAAALGSGTDYEVVAGDLGQQVTCTVTAVRAGYVDATSSRISSSVAAGTFSFAAPSVTGSARVGQPLICAVPAETPGTPSYAWTRDEEPVGTGPTYVPAPGDVGRVLTCAATVERPGYQDATKSADSAVITVGEATTYEVAILGTAKVGSTLRAEVTGLPAGATVSWQWLRGTTRIAGATGASYLLSGRQYGQRIGAVATIQVAGYENATASARTAPVGVGALTLKLSKAKIKVGGKVRITITRLLPGERWTLRFGNGRWVATGKANAAGGTIVRTVRLPARATFLHDPRRLVVTTTQPRRKAGANFALVR